MLLRIIKTAFNLNSLPYSLYLSAGFFLSQLLNIYVYAAKGSDSLQTWFKWAGIVDYQPSVKVVKILCMIMAIMVFFTLQFLIPKMRFDVGEHILTKGLIITFTLCMISQIMFSSAMRLSYEFSFCLIVFTGLICAQVFFQPIQHGLKWNPVMYQDLWTLLRVLIPLCIGFPILIGGGGFIASFYKAEQEFLRAQLYRHIAMALYFAIGAGLFLFFPLLKKLLAMQRLFY